jgi:hypothetical protein
MWLSSGGFPGFCAQSAPDMKETVATAAAAKKVRAFMLRA